MIRINLLGQIRPKSARRPVDTGAALPLLFVGLGALVGFVVLFYLYHTWSSQLNEENNRIKALTAEKTQLEQTKQQVEMFDKQRQVLIQRINVIEQLQRDRTGGQELLDMVANTVSRTENLWLTSMTRTGNNLAIEGSSASINSVANFITALKRSGYFQKVEIKESKQDDRTQAVQTFTFQLTAEISPPQVAPPAPAVQAKPASAPAKTAPPVAAAPGKKG